MTNLSIETIKVSDKMDKVKKTLLKSLVIVAIFLFFGFFLYRNIGAIRETYQITAGNMTYYLFWAIILAFVSELIITIAYRRIFSGLKIFRKLSEMMILCLASMAVNILVPSGGFSGAIVFADDTKKDESRAAAVTGFLLAGIADYSAISVLVIFAMLYLAGIGGLGLSVLIPALIFLSLTIFLYFLVWVSANGLDFIERLFKRIVKFISFILGKITKKTVNTEKATNNFIKEFSSASKYIFGHKKEWLFTIVTFILSHLARIIALYVIFLSLGYEPTYRALVTGYAIGTLFIIISPTPNGIGFVEGAMILSYTSLGASSTMATTAVLLYRGLVFWIPFLIGFISLQGSRIKKIQKESMELDV
jgi:uncharacterized protein (TIRG00374 family)